MNDATVYFNDRKLMRRIVRHYYHLKPGRFLTIFLLWWFKLGRALHLMSEASYQTHFWQTLLKRPLTTEQWATIKPRHLGTGTLVAQIPNAILEAWGVTGLGLPIDLQGQATATMPSVLDRVAQTDGPLTVAPKFYRRYLRSIRRREIGLRVGRRTLTLKQYQRRAWLWRLRDLITLLIAAYGITIGALIIATNRYNFQMVTDIIRRPDVLTMNSLMAIALMLILYLLFNNVGVGILLGSLPTLAIGITNFLMLKYRGSPLRYIDLSLASEAKNMGTRYNYMLPLKYLLIIGTFIVLALIVAFLFRAPAGHFGLRALLAVAVVIVSALSFKPLFLNDVRYTNIMAVTRANQWSGTNRYLTKGVVYSFLNTTNKDQLLPPANYSEAAAKAQLAKYKNVNIPKNKKVNIITIQLEAFNDFSKWSQIKIDPSVYAGLHTIQQEGVSGELTTNIFGGGTIDTERKVLTGYSKTPPITHPMLSFVDYFNQQGYLTEKRHPGYGWFYNRQNIERYLGFQHFYYKENYYDDHVSKDFIVKDSLVFDNLEASLKRANKNGQYLFNQTVTYQNHGPYDTTFSGTPLVTWQDGYNKSDYAIINNYLTGVRETSNALLKLVNSLKSYKEPVVLAFWGDHNPWGGAENSTYKMLGIDLDQSTTTGYKNYFDTPYVLWANPAAKKTLGNSFTGKGADISPMYVLPEIFKRANYTGSQYMQEVMAMEKNISVFGEDNRYLSDGKWTTTLKSSVAKQAKTFHDVEYYMETSAVKRN
ncbi:LTA synthase family protein [Lacticaseibacillus brantae]|uniref:Teichoic acid polysaccharide phosphoglycerol transferase n=1 Tax=Lacticaseibacillus brantae DSM 23927 TaxID=1423727 RepID=A0A0R2AXM3_9LACO|nr:LTA synthase family protein [Lacticaseibacillus brantae]KRM72142.1 teichoic acid polysaccharide phosphoglycerol transferase [Lacticaseibacillus brantae DSM 23927]